MPAEIRARKGGGAVVVTMAGCGYPELCREEGSSLGRECAGRVAGECLPWLCGLRWWRKGIRC